MPVLRNVIDHETVTRRSRFRYQFTPKHHGADANAAQWMPSLTLEEEFAVFDTADDRQLSDDGGNLYGVRPDAEGELRYLGTQKQQVAEFPAARVGEPWHGYPLYPLKDEGPENRRGEKLRPDKGIFDKMLRDGLITERQRRRLLKGDHV